MLQAAYHRRCHEEENACELVLIIGKSGIGKTALARHLQATVHANQGYCLSGKFDQLQGPKPYVPFVAAFTKGAELVDSINEMETIKNASKKRLMGMVVVSW
jgi:predicted ATPase